MLSYWERQSFLHYDHIVAGAGITGLSVALELSATYPGQRILVLERGVFPIGASTRNAGFACIGSAAELLQDLRDMNESDVLQLCIHRQEGLRMLRERLGDQYIDFRTNGSHELVAPHEKEVLTHIDRLNVLLRPLATKNQPVFRVANERIKPFGFNPQQTVGLIENTEEGELHTGKMMRRLTDIALSSGIEIKTGASVSEFEEHANRVTVRVASNTQNESVALSCNQFFVCTNAFAPMLLPNTGVQPGRGQVLVTSPLANLPFKGIFHFDSGYYYFREIDGRVLIGGGRNLNFEGETTTEIATTNQIQADLEDKLHQLVLPGRRNVPIKYRWAGIMAFGQDKKPIVKPFGKRVYGAFKFGGMGVALASFAAKQLVALTARS